LDRADYWRKPRGLPAALEDNFRRRPSFCCRAEGCLLSAIERYDMPVGIEVEPIS
jgi:hypothetical protein